MFYFHFPIFINLTIFTFRKEFHEGKNNVNAYIVFEQKESAEKALEM